MTRRRKIPQRIFLAFWRSEKGLALVSTLARTEQERAEADAKEFYTSSFITEYCPVPWGKAHQYARQVIYVLLGGEGEGIPYYMEENAKEDMRELNGMIGFKQYFVVPYLPNDD